jgi:putative transposase
VKVIKYTYKFRLEPSEEQKILLNKHFGSVRWTYNYFLNQRKEEYLDNKKSLNYYDQAKELTEIKKQEDKSWLKEINSQTLQFSLNCLDIAYQRFFKKRTKFPRFKSKTNRNSFTVPQFVSVNKNKLIIPKFREGIKMIMERKVKGIIKHCSISKTSTGKYFVSILTEQEYQATIKTNKSVGIDLGIKDFLVLSNGLKVKNHRFTKHYEKQLKLNQQHLSKKVKGSKHYERQRIKVAKIYEKITNSRLDLIHKTTTNLVKEFDTIYLEDLNIKGLTKRCKTKQDDVGNFLSNGQSAKSGLNKSILDVSWGTFIDILEYKANWNDKQVIHVDRFFPSSKTCSKCGWINNSLTLKDRSWTCINCNKKHDRDVNAAINILNEGYRKNIIESSEISLSVGTTDYEHGAKIRPTLVGTSFEVFKKKKHNVSETIIY